MTDQFLDQVGVQALALGGYSIAALLIVFVMRNKAPVWGPRAAKASWAVLILTFLIFPEDSPATAATTAVAILVSCTAVVITTALGSRLSRLPAPGAIRQASIAPRRLFVARVPHQRFAAVATGTLAVATMAAASLMARGSTLERHHNGATGSAPGFPGWPALAPALCAAAVLAGATWWALTEVRDRPRIDEPLDTLLRARDASRVLRVATFGCAVTTMQLLFSIGAHMNEATQSLRSHSETAPRAPWDFYQWTGFALYIPAVVLIFVALAALGGSVGTTREVRELEENMVNSGVRSTP